MVPGQLQDLTESADSAKIIYRLLQTFTIFIQRIKDDQEQETEIAVPEDPEETNE